MLVRACMMSSIPMQSIHLKCTCLFLQDMGNDLFAAAYSGNNGLFDLLVERFDLQPDQLRNVSVCLYLHCPYARYTFDFDSPLRAHPVVLSTTQPRGAIWQW